jgi:hypothetical protein
MMVTIEAALIAFPMQIHAQVLPAVTTVLVSSVALTKPFAFATTVTIETALIAFPM